MRADGRNRRHPLMPSLLSRRAVERRWNVPLSLSLVDSPQPLRDESRLGLAFDFDRDIPRALGTTFDVVDGRQRTMQANFCPRGNGRRKSDSIEAVVDGSRKVATNLNGLTLQMAEQRKGQKTMSDRCPERRFLFGAIGIDVNPLLVGCHFGKVVDQGLSDFKPVARADFSSH